ncbi:hypothetical protein ACJJTC_010121 [Scirpophaga incertulas]
MYIETYKASSIVVHIYENMCSEGMWLLLFKIHFVLLFFLHSVNVSDTRDRLAEELKKHGSSDLSADEEYEDLRAKFFAYRAVLNSLKSEDSRRSLQSTPCWKQKGICINHQLCIGFQFQTEVPGCRDKLKVCCFIWNKYAVKDMREHAIQNPAMPWSLQREYGGQGVILKTTTRKGRRNRTVHIARHNPKIAFIISSD